MPQPADNPWPKKPAIYSIPGIMRSGWPCKSPLIFLNFLYSSFEKNPFWHKIAYNPGLPCPLDKMKRSLSAQFGFDASIFNSWLKSTESISAAENDPPRCPEPASFNMSKTSFLIKLVDRFKSLIRSWDMFIF